MSTIGVIGCFVRLMSPVRRETESVPDAPDPTEDFLNEAALLAAAIDRPYSPRIAATVKPTEKAAVVSLPADGAESPAMAMLPVTWHDTRRHDGLFRDATIPAGWRYMRNEGGSLVDEWGERRAGMSSKLTPYDSYANIHATPHAIAAGGPEPFEDIHEHIAETRGVNLSLRGQMHAMYAMRGEGHDEAAHYLDERVSALREVRDAVTVETQSAQQRLVAQRLYRGEKAAKEPTATLTQLLGPVPAGPERASWIEAAGRIAEHCEIFEMEDAALVDATRTVNETEQPSLDALAAGLLNVQTTLGMEHQLLPGTVTQPQAATSNYDLGSVDPDTAFAELAEESWKALAMGVSGAEGPGPSRIARELLDEVGMGGSPSWSNGSGSCYYMRTGAIPKLRTAIAKRHRAGEGIAAPDKALLATLAQVAEVADDVYSLTNTQRAIEYVIAAHIEAKTNPGVLRAANESLRTAYAAELSPYGRGWEGGGFG